MSPILSEIAAEKSKSLEDLIEEAEAFLRDKKPTQRRKKQGEFAPVMGHKVGTLVCLRVTNICSKPDKLL